MMAEQLHAVVHGRVQGVSFRHYTMLRARELGLTGWVRNLPDGTVETTAEGDKTALDALLDFLQDGPPAAHVSRVDESWHTASGKFVDFTVRFGSG
jgi:acylphosphatase